MLIETFSIKHFITIIIISLLYLLWITSYTQYFHSDNLNIVYFKFYSVLWTHFYSIEPSNCPLPAAQCQQHLHIPPPPRIIDPANPAMNVWETGFTSCQCERRQSNCAPRDGYNVLLKEWIAALTLHRCIIFKKTQNQNC